MDVINRINQTASLLQDADFLCIPKETRALYRAFINANYKPEYYSELNKDARDYIDLGMTLNEFAELI